MKDEWNGHVLGRLGEYADLRNHAAHLQCAKRTREGADAADFDDEIDAFAAGLIQHPVVPLGGFTVGQTLIEAEIECALDFGGAA